MKTHKNSNTFPERLKRLMEQRGLTQEAVGAKMGLSHSSVSRWLGGSVPRADAAKKLASVLAVNAEWLISGKGVRDPAKGFEIMLRTFSEVAQQYEPKNPEVLLGRLVDAAEPLMDALHEKADAADATGGEWQARAQEAEKRLALNKAQLEKLLKEF